MKYLKLLTFGILLLCLFNCSKDDDTTETPYKPTISEQLAGKWYLIELINISSDTQIILNDCEKNSYYQFDVNKNFQSELYNLDDDNCIANEIIYATYEIIELDGEYGIRITHETSTELSKIVNLTDTELILENQAFGVRHTVFNRG
ncbi:lipocalin family protein [Bizionia sp. KMM 8389]